jgi:flagellar biosynthetic protein FliP
VEPGTGGAPQGSRFLRKGANPSGAAPGGRGIAPAPGRGSRGRICRRTNPSGVTVSTRDRAGLFFAVLRRPSLLLAVTAILLLVAHPAAAQQIQIDLGNGQSFSLRTVQLFLLLTLLSLAPGLAIMVTCFPFMVTVLSILRQAIGVQQAPPNMINESLALFLTWFVMEPVFDQAWTDGIAPMVAGEITPEAAFAPVMAPFRDFMAGRADPETVQLLAEAAPVPPAATAEAPLSILVPAFLLSEISRGFEVGFLIFLPFLVIDLVVAAVLMSMGMMMVPPSLVSLPFKLAFFVIADGWSLLAGALVRSYAP